MVDNVASTFYVVIDMSVITCTIKSCQYGTLSRQRARILSRVSLVLTVRFLPLYVEEAGLCHVFRANAMPSDILTVVGIIARLPRPGGD